MPVVRAQRKTTGLEALSQSLAGAIQSIARMKELKGQQRMEEAVAQASIPLPNDTPQSRYHRIMQAVQTVRQESQPSGPFGVPVLDKALGAFNPNVPTFITQAPVMNLVTSGIQRDWANQQALEKQKQWRQYQIEHPTPYEQSRIDYYNQRGGLSTGMASLLNFAATQVEQGIWSEDQQAEFLSKYGIELPGQTSNINQPKTPDLSLLDPEAQEVFSALTPAYQNQAIHILLNGSPDQVNALNTTLKSWNSQNTSKVSQSTPSNVTTTTNIPISPKGKKSQEAVSPLGMKGVELTTNAFISSGKPVAKTPISSTGVDTITGAFPRIGTPALTSKPTNISPAGLEEIWPELEQLGETAKQSALNKLAEGYTPEEIITQYKKWKIAQGK